MNKILLALTILVFFPGVSMGAAGAARPAARLKAIAAANVHVALRDSATIQPDGNGFFALGDIADITGGDAETRNHLRTVSVGRAPLAGLTRKLNLGDVALKLRQAGVNPDVDVVLGGSEITLVTCTGSQPTPYTTPVLTAPAANPTSVKPAAAGDGPEIVVHRGDSVVIVVQDDVLTVRTVGQCRESGAVGDTIHVHRNGVMTDLTAQVIDAHTVQVEM